MPLNTQSFDQFVQNEVAAAQASSASLLDFSTGSVLLALIQANVTALGLFLQAQAVYDLSIARASTSIGSDLDSWMADFAFTRLPAIAATGQVTFSRVNTTSQAVIPVGAQVQTTTGQAYTVILDTTNSAYNSALNGYVISVSTSSVTIVVNANTAGIAGNAIANAINVITTPIPYVDSVTNASAFINGVDIETDTDFRARFVNYLGSLSAATISAVEFAIESVQGVVSYTVTENQNYSGSSQNGYFYIVVDDGTGTPSDNLVSNVNNAVDAIVGLTVTFGVFKPIVTDATVVLTVTVASGYTHSVVAPIVQSALTNYINNLSVGEALYFSRIPQIAYDASPGVLDVSSITLNSGTSDLTANNQHKIILIVSYSIN